MPGARRLPYCVTPSSRSSVRSRESETGVMPSSDATYLLGTMSITPGVLLEEPQVAVAAALLRHEPADLPVLAPRLAEHLDVEVVRREARLEQLVDERHAHADDLPLAEHLDRRGGRPVEVDARHEDRARPEDDAVRDLAPLRVDREAAPQPRDEEVHHGLDGPRLDQPIALAELPPQRVRAERPEKALVRDANNVSEERLVLHGQPPHVLCVDDSTPRRRARSAPRPAAGPRRVRGSRGPSPRRRASAPPRTSRAWWGSSR